MTFIGSDFLLFELEVETRPSKLLRGRNQTRASPHTHSKHMGQSSLVIVGKTTINPATSAAVVLGEISQAFCAHWHQIVPVI
jgi:hypothetical protein